MHPREAYSRDRLERLGRSLQPVAPLLAEEPLCVYATGSYGRLEAGTASDIDLFFLYDAAERTSTFPFVSFVRLAAALIDATEKLEFPPFSGDGRYLEVLHVNDMEDVLGSPRDDSDNSFTARMLLLLESQPLTDADLYSRLLRKIVGLYYRDFTDHAADFFPTFLLNDILRFWRTLTLNYEHDRLKLRGLAGPELEDRKARSALKNYKLKISRMSTCFSMVASLVAQAEPVSPDKVVELCRLTPSERFARLASSSVDADERVTELTSRYETFLAFVQRDEATVLVELSDEGRRRTAAQQATEYGDVMYGLLKAVASERRLRYLVV